MPLRAVNGNSHHFSDSVLPTCTSQTSLHMGFPDHEIGSKSEPNVAADLQQDLRQDPAQIREWGLHRDWSSTDFGNPDLEGNVSL